MRIYISGPMTGLLEHNFAAFNRAAEQIRFRGHEAVNPAEMDGPDFDHDNPRPWEWYLHRDIKVLLDCDALFMLHGWASSRGATLERLIALVLGKPVFYRYTDLEEGIAHDQ